MKNFMLYLVVGVSLGVAGCGGDGTSASGSGVSLQSAPGSVTVDTSDKGSGARLESVLNNGQTPPEVVIELPNGDTVLGGGHRKPDHF